MTGDQTWTNQDVSALWGWVHGGAPQEIVPIEERCWRCDGRRMHDGCAAGLCDVCCRELKKASAA